MNAILGEFGTLALFDRVILGKISHRAQWFTFAFVLNALKTSFQKIVERFINSKIEKARSRKM